MARRKLNSTAKRATGSKKRGKATAKKKAPIPTTGKLRTGGAVAAAAPLGFNNALPSNGAKSEPPKRKKKARGKKENSGRRKARVARSY